VNVYIVKYLWDVAQVLRVEIVPPETKGGTTPSLEGKLNAKKQLNDLADSTLQLTK